MLRRYVGGAGVDERLVFLDYAATVDERHYYHTDHQGSVIAMHQDDGLVKAYTYDSYGKQQSGLSVQPFGYTGRRYDNATGLYYYRARFYNPEIGRFLQTDPIGYKADMNLYAYVGNDPMNLNDPNGENPLAAARGAVWVGVRVGTNPAVIRACAASAACRRVAMWTARQVTSIIGDIVNNDTPVEDSPVGDTGEITEGDDTGEEGAKEGEITITGLPPGLTIPPADPLEGTNSEARVPDKKGMPDGGGDDEEPKTLLGKVMKFVQRVMELTDNGNN